VGLEGHLGVEPPVACGTGVLGGGGPLGLGRDPKLNLAAAGVLRGGGGGGACCCGAATSADMMQTCRLECNLSSLGTRSGLACRKQSCNGGNQLMDN